MPVPVAVPKLGNRMRAGLVSEWYQPDGAVVQSGDLVCCLECDFVAVDIEADGDGVLRHRIDAGLIRPPGDLLGVVLARGERMPEFEPVDLDAPLPELPDDPDVPPAGTVALRPAAWEESVAQPPRAVAKPDAPAARVAQPEAVARASQQPAPVDEIVKAIAMSPDFAPAHPAEHPQTDVEETPVAEPIEPVLKSQHPAHDAATAEVLTEAADSARQVENDESDGADEPANVVTPPIPFPKRFASFEIEPPGDGLWDSAVPGDAGDFESALMPVPRDAILEAHVDPRSPGDAEHDETPESTELADWLKTEPAPRPAPVAAAAEAPQYAWAAWEADTQASAANARVLSMSITAALGEAHKMREQLGREWRVQGIRPSTEDIVVRAVARAFRDLPGQWTGSVALRTLTDGAEFTRVLQAAGSRPFRDAVLAMQAAGPGASDCVVTSHAGDGVESATPRLRGESVLAVSLGAERQAPSWQGDHWAPSNVATISISYDAAALADGAAGRFIARVRELVESPYALLAD